METLADLLELARQYDEEQLPPAAAMPEAPSGPEIASWIDHTLLKPEATAEQIKTLCQEARQYRFASVCINPAYVPLAAGLLAGSPVMVCTVVGFPLGADIQTQKVLEALACINAGAVEIDMVQNIGALKGQAYGQVLNEIQAVAQIAHNQRAIVKVILETALLTRREKIIACLICKAAGADFVKTSTGFGPGGATLEDVELMHRVVGPEVKVKAAGGIRTLEDTRAMIKAGASRIGASAGVKIVQEAQS
ncbi:MAG: deoxyribose-phosphate aldolase [Anaerolineales bacterium]|jgi:deoxyribose-phosphate aldolase